MAEIIDEKYEREPDGWRKRRLLAIKLVAHGEMTSAQIADSVQQFVNSKTNIPVMLNVEAVDYEGVK